MPAICLRYGAKPLIRTIPALTLRAPSAPKFVPDKFVAGMARSYKGISR